MQITGLMVVLLWACNCIVFMEIAICQIFHNLIVIVENMTLYILYSLASYDIQFCRELCFLLTVNHMSYRSVWRCSSSRLVTACCCLFIHMLTFLSRQFNLERFRVLGDLTQPLWTGKGHILHIGYFPSTDSSIISDVLLDTDRDD